MRLAILALDHGLHVVTAVPAVIGEDQLQRIPDLVAAVKRSGRLYQMNETTAFRGNCHAMRKIFEAGGHGGSHGYLTDDFLRGILLKDHRICVDLKTALDTTVCGIYAHRSAMKDGETLKIPACT